MKNYNSVNVAVINKAGKVGKSSISKHLIAPMLSASWIKVETFNSSAEGSDAKINGRKFDYVAERILAREQSFCIDVGSSNYQAVMKSLEEIDGISHEIDFWVVPCRESAGVITDSLSTIEDLVNELRVDPAKIIVIQNFIEDTEEPSKVFDGVVAAARDVGFSFCRVAIPHNPKFDSFDAEKKSVMEIASDDTDFDALIEKESNSEERLRLTREVIAVRRAKSLAGRLREVWYATPLAEITYKREWGQ